MTARDLQKSARIAERDGDIDNAEALYKQLIDEYPESKEARDAAHDLKDIERKLIANHAETAQVQSSHDAGRSGAGIASIRADDGVKIIDISMPFMSMVFFLIKVAFASIPAGVVLFIFWFIVLSIFGL